MANVFANGLEISGKAVNAQTIAAMPDVCFTPPENPATPPGVPVPYPSFGMASDTEQGTGTVFIKGKTVNIKNKSDEKKTSGTEAGCAAKKGVITSKNTGKKYFHKWSNNVKFEGEPVIRFSDLGSHNHASPIGNTPPWLEVSRANPAWTKTCEKVYIERMSTYDPNECATPEYESHHLIDNSSFSRPGARKISKTAFGAAAAGMADRVWKKLRNLFQSGSPHPGGNYHEGDPPCICLEGNPNDPGTEHAVAHDITEAAALKSPTVGQGKWTYKEARAAAVNSAKKSADLTKKESECVGIMLDSYYKEELGCTDSTEIRAPGTQPNPRAKFATGRGGNANMSAAPR